MNSHTWLRACPPTTRAGPRLRAGLTEVPVMGMPIRWTTVRPRPMARPASGGGHQLAGGSQHHVDEQDGEDHLREKGAHRVDPNHGQGPEAVSPQTLEVTGIDRRGGEDAPQHESAGDAPQELGDPEFHRLQERHPARGRKPMVTAGLI